jgi:acylphosphatase
MFTEVHCYISGRVQGVAYRDFVQNEANQHHLTGWVKNLSDGRVEILAQGLPDDLKEFTKELQHGSVLAKVESVGAEWGTPTKRFDDFTVIYNK